MDDTSDNKPVVYIPPNAKINVENRVEESPKTKYEQRRFIFDLERVKDVVGGLYGRKKD